MSAEIVEYIEEMKVIQEHILNFLEDDDNIEDNYQKLMNIIFEKKIQEDKVKTASVLRLINKISKNHYRNQNFFQKICAILQQLLIPFKQTYSNLEIFNFFKYNKIILLFLIEEEIIKIDKLIATEMLKPPFQSMNYIQFFYPEIRQFIDIKTIEGIDNEEVNYLNDNKFIEKRRIGENDNEICQIIRKDSLDEFITYTNTKKVTLSSKIKRSIYETNSFLLSKTPTLIEYAAFYGSFSISKYLFSKGIQLTSSLWLYSIHCPNDNFFDLFYTNFIKPPHYKNSESDISYEKCIEESIKCHHNIVANYFINNFSINDEIKNFHNNIIAYSFHYCNYVFIPTNTNNKFMFFYACQYKYINLVKLLLMNKSLNLNDKIISKKNFFYLMLFHKIIV